MTPPKPLPAAGIHLVLDPSADRRRSWCDLEASDDNGMTSVLGFITCLTCLDLVANYGDAARQRMVTLHKDGAQ